jgi:acyl-CoA synthetase (AMP-forming)/AMP-acid ligase II
VTPAGHDYCESVEGLLTWLDQPSEDRGIHFLEEREEWTFTSYATLAAEVEAAAAAIQRERSVTPGPVAILRPTGPQFVAAFFGALLAGGTPCPLAPPDFLADPVDYRRHLGQVLATARPSLIVTTTALEPTVAEVLASASLGATPVTTSLAGVPADLVTELPAELALLQFTSGSSGRPRGARVTPANLVSNIEMMRRWLGLREDDVVVSWLPLFHDMGLIGCLLTPMTAGIDLYVMRPDQFVRAPHRWLACFGEGPGTIGVSPGFGFAYSCRHVAEEQLRGFDFGNWRVALVAAERIDPAVLGEFTAMAEPHGFSPEAFLPAYGLAEATLAVTGGHLEHRPPATKIDWANLRPGGAVDVLDTAEAGRDETAEGAGWLVGCGHPHPGVVVEVVDEAGAALPTMHLGEIAVTGPTTVDGYQGDEHGGSSTFDGARLLTGDAGFLIDDELYVVGRIGDSLKVRGRGVYMEDLETRLTRIPGVSRGRCVALSGSTAAGNCLLALIEAEPGPWVEQVASELTRAVGHEAEIKVLQAKRGTIQRTSSGKPRRRPMWAALLGGTLDARLVHHALPSAWRTSPVTATGRTGVAPDAEAA